MLELNNNNIKQELSSHPTLVVDFGAEWCGSCQELEPAFHNISKEINKAKFARVDLAKDESLAATFNIRNYPTVVIFKNGQETKRFEGFSSEYDLKEKIKSSL